MRNTPSIEFSAKRACGGFYPVADGGVPGSYFGGQKVFVRHILPTREEAIAKAEALYWERLDKTTFN